MSTGEPGARDRLRRIADHQRVSAVLAGLDDAEFAALLAHSGDTVGIGGSTCRIDLDGVAVFVKRIPLTHLELGSDARGSTANLFGLPAHCHYGIGGPGFGAWRELAATATVSDWVLDGHSDRFLLLHHWRVLPGAPPLSGELGDITRAAAFWDDDPTVRARLHALAAAPASLLLFLEHQPHTLSHWLTEQARHGEPAVAAAAAFLETELIAVTRAMTARGVIHFDAHFDNVLTDGHRLYLADLGLALGPDFALSPDEATLAASHRTHDLAYVLTRLVNWLVTTLGDPTEVHPPVARNDYIRRCATHGHTLGLPAAVAATVARHAPVAALVNDFYAELFTRNRRAAYPAAALEAALRCAPEPDR